MDRRAFLGRTFCAAAAGGGLIFAGCRNTMTGTVMKNDQKDMVGNCSAGAETFKPLIDECVCKLLARHSSHMPPTPGGPAPQKKRVCFVGLQNKSSEDIGDFKDQIVEIIDTQIIQSAAFQSISRQFVDAGLKEARVRYEELLVPIHRQRFQAVMEKCNSPFDYLLFATLSSGTTRSGGNFQRDYMLTLELVDLAGNADKEMAHLRKGYTRGVMGKFGHG